MAREDIEKFAANLKKVQLKYEVTPQAINLARAAVLGDSDGVGQALLNANLAIRGTVIVNEELLAAAKRIERRTQPKQGKLANPRATPALEPSEENIVDSAHIPVPLVSTDKIVLVHEPGLNGFAQNLTAFKEAAIEVVKDAELTDPLTEVTVGECDMVEVRSPSQVVSESVDEAGEIDSKPEPEIDLEPEPDLSKGPDESDLKQLEAEALAALNEDQVEGKGSKAQLIVPVEQIRTFSDAHYSMELLYSQVHPIPRAVMKAALVQPNGPGLALTDLDNDQRRIVPLALPRNEDGERVYPPIEVIAEEAGLTGGNSKTILASALTKLRPFWNERSQTSWRRFPRIAASLEAIYQDPYLPLGPFQLVKEILIRQKPEQALFDWLKAKQARDDEVAKQETERIANITAARTFVEGIKHPSMILDEREIAQVSGYLLGLPGLTETTKSSLEFAASTFNSKINIPLELRAGYTNHIIYMLNKAREEGTSPQFSRGQASLKKLVGELLKTEKKVEDKGK